MQSPLMFCEEHGFMELPLKFKSDLGSIRINMVGSRTRCPVCDKVVPIVDGSYDYVDGVIERARLQLSVSQTHRLRQSLRWAQQELAKAEPDEDRMVRVLERTIEEQAPQLKTWLDRLRDPAVGNVAGWVAVLVSILMWVTSQAAPVSEDDVRRVVEETIHSETTEQERAGQGGSGTPGARPPYPEAPPRATEIPTPKTR